ncbi:transglutaminase domain-containing protein [Pontiellaceae bacterium B12227]|nr:transglutaminase domain-containing protein [Pontiellaceae bacterium B12227]
MNPITLLPVLTAVISVLTPSSPAKPVEGTITLKMDLSAQPQEEPVRLWLPYPTSDRNQDISKVSLSGNYATSAVYTDKIFGSAMLYAEWPAGSESRTLTLVFDAAREEITRPEWPAQPLPWNAADHALYLRPTKNAPLTDDVQQLANRITSDKMTVLGKARAIYDWTVDNTYRNPETRGCGTGDVCTLLNDPGGKCADISSIYIALCRAAGIPSREVLGIRMGKKAEQDITTWQHCWAEFYLPGTGWVSVDPADVRKKMLVEKLSLSDPKTAAYREYFFGGIDAYRIKLGQGRDMLPSPEPTGGAINYLMYPYAQVGDRPLDWLDPQAFKYTITYTQAPEKD